MEFDRIIDRPDSNTLDAVLAGRRLDLIAPFARKGPLERLNPQAHDRIRIISRFPTKPAHLVNRLDNDPRDFLELHARLGARVQIYALPSVHTKLYLNGERAYYGSSNFTSTGFGGNPESLISIVEQDTYLLFSHMFLNYLNQANRISVSYLRGLRARLESGNAVFTASPDGPVTLQASAMGNDVAHFRNWLVGLHEGDADYIEARFDPGAGYNMTGHTQSAFPGMRAFLRENLDLIPQLAAQDYEPYVFWQRNPEASRRMAQFVQTRGHFYPARGGGAWNRKLPPFLGGVGQNGGGRGSGLIARMFIYLSRYAIAFGF